MSVGGPTKEQIARYLNNAMSEIKTRMHYDEGWEIECVDIVSIKNDEIIKCDSPKESPWFLILEKTPLIYGMKNGILTNGKEFKTIEYYDGHIIWGNNVVPESIIEKVLEACRKFISEIETSEN